MKHGVAQDQLDAALAVIDRAIGPGTALGVYLYGSAAAGGLRADSDLDLFAVTGRRLTSDEKRRLVEGLLPISGRETRPPSWRALELTVVVQSEVRPWRYPPRCDFQYGEWLRDELVGGDPEPWPVTNPDLAVLITMILATGRPLFGPVPAELLGPVPHRDLVRAMVAELPSLLDDLEPDTRNVVLTLARVWCTVATGDIRSKDAAADWALPHLPLRHRPVLARARNLYLEGGDGSWPDMSAVRTHAEVVVGEILRLAGGSN